MGIPVPGGRSREELGLVPKHLIEELLEYLYSIGLARHRLVGR
jgi:hypothetical protein